MMPACGACGHDAGEHRGYLGQLEARCMSEGSAPFLEELRHPPMCACAGYP
jgi:hypothetical protein